MRTKKDKIVYTHFFVLSRKTRYDKSIWQVIKTKGLLNEKMREREIVCECEIQREQEGEREIERKRKRHRVSRQEETPDRKTSTVDHFMT